MKIKCCFCGKEFDTLKCPHCKYGYYFEWNSIYDGKFWNCDSCRHRPKGNPNNYVCPNCGRKNK